ncbi:DUF1435 domain-containing protein [Franconibacter helveticus 513]|uniref:DUF1435 domain-containing protein n=1 Tax=Franconibacter helveticus TaxID=357240 RepID=UPI0004652EB9|nr:DUF1435 domain-containing protein [Franconibacter helveticus]
MILVIIIGVRGISMLQKRLESGWGIIVPGLLVTLLALSDLTFAQWRIVVVVALLATSLMLFHKRLRHFLLLPSCIAFASVLMLIVMNLKG